MRTILKRIFKVFRRPSAGSKSSIRQRSSLARHLHASKCIMGRARQRDGFKALWTLQSWLLGLLLLLVGTRCASGATFGFSNSFTDTANPFVVVECDAACTSPSSVTLDVVVERSGDLSSSETVYISTRAASDSSVRSATAGDDYTVLDSVAITFAATESQQTVSMTIISDGVYEQDEVFEAFLENPSLGATLDEGASTAYFLIRDGGDAGIFSFGAQSYTFQENAGTVQVKIVRGGGASGDVQVVYRLSRTTEATAKANQNFRLVDSVYQVDFVPDQREGSIDVEIINDNVYEANEFFYLEISALSPATSGAKFGTIPSTVVFISDDGDAGEFNFAAPYIFCREDSGFATVTIERSNGFSSSSYIPVELVVATVADGTGNATEGGSKAFDYLAKSQKLTWATNQVMQKFSVKVFNNEKYEPEARAVKLRLQSVAGGASIGAESEMWIYIVDDRDAGTLSFDQPHYEVLENAGSVTVTVTRSGISDSENVNTYTDGIVTVDVATYGGTIMPGKARYDLDYDYGVVEERGCSQVSPCTAEADVAYTAVQSTRLTFVDGESSKTVAIVIQDNDLFQAPNQVFKVILKNVNNGAHLGIDYEHPDEWNVYPSEFLALETRQDELLDNVGAIVTIKDDGDPAVLVSKASLSVSEIGQVDSFRIRLNSQPSADVSVTVGFNADQLFVSPSSLTFSSLTWNEDQVVEVSAVPDELADGIHESLVSLSLSSSDASYSAPLRTSTGLDGFTVGKSVYTQLWGIYNTGNQQHAFPWEEGDGVMTSPSTQASVSVFILDDDHPGVIINPESNRHQSGAYNPRNIVCVREGGHSASLTIKLRSEPQADVEITFVPEADSGIQSTPESIRFTSLSWNDAQQIALSAAPSSNSKLSEKVQFSTLSMYASSVGDALYNQGASPIGTLAVQRFPAAQVIMNAATSTVHENGGADAVAAYELKLGSEPMHWEPLSNEYEPFQLTLQVSADTTLTFPSNVQGNSGTASKLTVASNSSASTSDAPVASIAVVRFDVHPAVETRTGSLQVGLARLRLFRISGGENGGLGGIVVGASAAAAGSSDGWNEESLQTDCTYPAEGSSLSCSFTDGVSAVPSLFPGDTTFQTIASKTDGETVIVQSSEVDASTNAFIPSSGWVELDVTAALNRVLAQQRGLQGSVQDSTISFLVYSRSAAAFVYDGVDELVFASSQHEDDSLHPQLQIVASGSVNLALSASVSQSQTGNAKAAIDGKTDSNSGIASTFAMSRTVGSYPWWQADLKAIRSIEEIVVTVKKKASTATLRESQLATSFWVLFSKTSLTASNTGQAGFLAAQSAALFSRQFVVSSRSFEASEADTIVYRWRVNGEANGQFGDGRFIADFSAPAEARYVLLQVEGVNSLVLNEVEIFQQAFASARIAIGGFMPSLSSAVKGENQIEFSTSSFQGADEVFCDAETRICRRELLFTSNDWDTAQEVQVRVVDDNVATGDRDILMTHTAESLDRDYAGSSLCQIPSDALQPACNNNLFSESSVKTLTILEDDENKVILSKAELQLVEGSCAYSTAETFYRQSHLQPRFARCSSDPSNVLSIEETPQTRCAAAFQETPKSSWKVCIANSSAPPLDSGSAWMMAGFETPQNVSDISLLIPAMTDAKYVREISVWWTSENTLTDATASIVNAIDGWTKLQTISVAMKSNGTQAVALNNLLLFPVSSLLITFDASYDEIEGCVRAPQVGITGYEPVPFPLPVRGDLTSVDSIPPQQSRLSRMHLFGASDSLQVRLSSEPTADTLVSIVLEDGNEDVTAFDATNVSSAQTLLSDLLGANYESGDQRTHRLPNALRFTPGNWNVKQELTFLAVDDNTFRGNRTFSLRLSCESIDSSEAIIPHQAVVDGALSYDFVTLAAALSYSNAEFVVRDFEEETWPYHITSEWRSVTGAVQVDVTDDDLPGATISDSVVVVSESGPDGNFSVSLDSAPLQDVTIQLSYERDEALLRVQPLELIFTRLNWYQPQQITIYPVANTQYDGANPFTVDYERGIAKAKQPLILHQVSSADVSYNGLGVGTNEPDRQDAYVVNQGVRVIVLDDDTGCDGEYECMSGGECMRETHGSVCRCPATFGMKDCSALCKSEGDCEFDRLLLRLRCFPENPGAICSNTFSAGTLVATIFRMLTTREFIALDGTVHPKLSLGAVAEAIYIVNRSTAGCLDGSKACLEVAIDFLRPTTSVTSVIDKLFAYQEAGSLNAAPMHVELLSSDPQYERSMSATVILWGFVGVFGLAVIVTGIFFGVRAGRAKTSHVTPDSELQGEHTELLAVSPATQQGPDAAASPVST